MKNGIDLHIHTSKSDGSLTPTALVKYAAEIGLKSIAITDHDTIAGINEALLAAEKYDIDVIPGVEISSYEEIEYHILGYFSKQTYKDIDITLKPIREKRDERNPKIVKKLQELGYDITMNEVIRQASNGAVIGRVHIAKVLIEKNIVNSISEAFDNYLSEGKAAYVERERLTPEKCIFEIRKAGGVPVLAHPKYLNISMGEFTKVLKKLKNAGLMGLEVYYSDNTYQEVGFYEFIAQKMDLTMTGGSDFHGENREVKLGSGINDISTADEIISRLKQSILSGI